MMAFGCIVLDARGIINHIIEAASVHVSRKARRAKTDRLDAENLVRVLIAYWRGEPKVCSVVRPPSIEEEDAKRQHREREFLIEGARATYRAHQGIVGHARGLRLSTEPQRLAKSLV